jgi:hypothetical protein
MLSTSQLANYTAIVIILATLAYAHFTKKEVVEKPREVKYINNIM